MRTSTDQLQIVYSMTYCNFICGHSLRTKLLAPDLVHFPRLIIILTFSAVWELCLLWSFVGATKGKSAVPQTDIYQHE